MFHQFAAMHCTFSFDW